MQLGFDVKPAAPLDVRVARPGAGAPASPARLETKPSLLSLALSDLPLTGAGSLAFAAPSDLCGSGTPTLGLLQSVAQDHLQADLDAAPLDALAAQHPALGAPVVRAAYAAAARAHAGQRRRSGEPVLSHCLETAAILADLGMPEETVAAGMLHDVLSDTRMTACQLEEYVPRSCVEMVEKVTRLSELSQLYRDNAHSLEAASILDMLTSMDDVGALLIKLADRLHNMRTIGALPRCKQVRVATETMEVFAVLANRLGAWSLKAELEDLAFRTLHQEEYEQVAAAIAERAAEIDLPARVTGVRAALAAAGLEAVDVSGRVKNAYGVWRKLRAAGLGVEGIGEVYDVAALRVVVPSKHDCYWALREVERLWAPVPGRFKDYIRSRKGNGYQSLHTTVVASADTAVAAAAMLEVQIRTPKMHFLAEYGFAAHWRYKEKLPTEDIFLDRLVQWKKWVATEKLRLRDAKVREGGSPGRDAAIAGLLDSAALAAASLAASPAAALEALAPAAAAAASQLQLQQRQQHQQRRGSPSSGGSPLSSAELDARFLARFGVRPPSDDDLEAQGASIVVSGPRGVRVESVPARCTLARLLSSGAVSDAEARGCSVRLNGEPVPLLARREVVLQTGDHLAFVEEPCLAPTRTGGGWLSGVAAVTGAAGSAALVVGADSDDLPPLTVFMPREGAGPADVSLGRKLAASTSQLRRAALAL